MEELNKDLLEILPVEEWADKYTPQLVKDLRIDFEMLKDSTLDEKVRSALIMIRQEIQKLAGRK